MFQRSFRPRCTALAAVFLLGSPLACGPSESADPIDDASGLDGSDIDSLDDPGSGVDGAREVQFNLPAGSTRANSELRVVNLDDDAAVMSVPTDADGGAAFSVSMAVGDEVRLQLVSEERRYRPVDYTLSLAEGRYFLTPSPRHSCLELEPRSELGFELDLAQLSFYNDCPSTLILSEPRLRTGELGSDFELVTLMPVELGGGVSAGIELRLAGAASRPAENILFLDADVDSERLRYAIGLYAPR